MTDTAPTTPPTTQLTPAAAPKKGRKAGKPADPTAPKKPRTQAQIRQVALGRILRAVDGFSPSEQGRMLQAASMLLDNDKPVGAMSEHLQATSE